MPDQELKEHNFSTPSQYVPRRHHSRRIRSRHTRQLGIAISSQGETRWFWVLRESPQQPLLYGSLPKSHAPPTLPWSQRAERRPLPTSQSPSSLGNFPLYATIFRYTMIAKTSGTASAFSLNPRASPHKTSQFLSKREASSYNQPFHWGEQVQWSMDICSSR